MDDRTLAASKSSGQINLTVREIRGLLTKHAQELVLSLRTAASTVQASEEEAQPMSFREFIRHMGPSLSMN